MFGWWSQLWLCRWRVARRFRTRDRHSRKPTNSCAQVSNSTASDGGDHRLRGSDEPVGCGDSRQPWSGARRYDISRPCHRRWPPRHTGRHRAGASGPFIVRNGSTGNGPIAACEEDARLALHALELSAADDRSQREVRLVLLTTDQARAERIAS